MPFRITRLEEKVPLTAPMNRWDNVEEKDADRYWNDGGWSPWMYWETFWVPTEPGGVAAATPASDYGTDGMLEPLLATQDYSTSAAYLLEVDPRQAMFQGDTGEAAKSTAVSKVNKSRAYEIVYEYNVWGSDTSRSGTVSDLWSPEARLATAALEAVIDSFGIRSVVDCACGDATWVVPFFVTRSDVAYTGIDIVPSVIEQNRQRFQGVDFLCLDAAVDPLPTGADLIFSKETMNHMPLEDAQRTLESFAQTGASYLLTNVHVGAQNEKGRNKTCFTTYIHYDYELPPFSMRKLASVVEYQGAGTSYALFALR